VSCLVILQFSWLAECLVCSPVFSLLADFAVRLIDLLVILQLGRSAFR